jgi:hypothetical protein
MICNWCKAHKRIIFFTSSADLKRHKYLVHDSVPAEMRRNTSSVSDQTIVELLLSGLDMKTVATKVNLTRYAVVARLARIKLREIRNIHSKNNS